MYRNIKSIIGGSVEGGNIRRYVEEHRDGVIKNGTWTGPGDLKSISRSLKGQERDDDLGVSNSLRSNEEGKEYVCENIPEAFCTSQTWCNAELHTSEGKTRYRTFRKCIKMTPGAS